MPAGKLAAAGNCAEGDGPYKGFTLTLKDLKLNQSHVIHRDSAVPASRGCPLGYAITAVVAPMGYPDTDRLVAMVSVFTRGFEGVDERFIAVPFTISD
jgi:predicted secreted protein